MGGSPHRRQEPGTKLLKRRWWDAAVSPSAKTAAGDWPGAAGPWTCFNSTASFLELKNDGLTTRQILQAGTPRCAPGHQALP